MKPLILAFVFFLALLVPAKAQTIIINTLPVIVYSGKTDAGLFDLLNITDILVIKNGLGGNVDGMSDVVDYLNANPQKTVIIDGDCYSACTLLASVPTTTLTGKATLHFHSASRNQCVEGELRSSMSLMANLFMMVMFDSRVQDWINESKALSSVEFTKMPDDKMRELFANQYVDSWQNVGTRMSIHMTYAMGNPC